MSCTETRLRFEALLRGALDASDAASARSHAAGCEACGRELREMEQVDGMLGQWQPDPGAMDVWPAVQAKLPQKRWSGLRISAAAAVLVAAAGIAFHVAGGGEVAKPVNPTPGCILIVPEPVAMARYENRAIARHAEIASANPPRAGVSYAYVGTYDEALNTKTYDAWSDKAASAARPAEGLSTAGLLVPPAYVPRGSVLKRVEPAIATAEAAWTTPMGELTVLQSAGASGGASFETVVGGGREIKYTRFPAAGVDVTLVSEGLPWPEVERIKKGFGAGK